VRRAREIEWKRFSLGGQGRNMIQKQGDQIGMLMNNFKKMDLCIETESKTFILTTSLVTS
jgi:hypothetical protein